MFRAGARGADAPLVLHTSARAARPHRAACSGWKRALDLVGAIGLLVVLFPLMALIALLIVAESRGPVFFRQRRGGLGGQAFTIFKFRTMTVLEDGDAVQSARRNDQRTTRLGRFLRRSSLDELPQLINVVTGEMSLVGPRPHALAHDRQFAQQLANYDRRFVVKPGVTGLAQVRGHRGSIETVDDLKARVQADLEYIDRWSVWSDLKILVATFAAPLHDRAY